MNKTVSFLLVVLPMVIVLVGYLIYDEIGQKTKVTLAENPVVLPDTFNNTYDDEFKNLPENIQQQFTKKEFFQAFSNHTGFRKRLSIAAQYTDVLTDWEFQALMEDDPKYESGRDHVKAVLNIQ